MKVRYPMFSERISVPSEILLNISELVGEREGLTLHNQELIERIQLYKPEFNYNKWLEQRRIKREFVSKVKKSPLNELYNYAFEHDVELNLTVGRNSFRVSSFPDREEDTRNIYLLLVKLGYNMEDPITYLALNPHTVMFSDEYEFFEFQEELLNVWLYRARRLDIPYHTAIERIQPSEDILSIIDALPIPVTLDGYLQYIAGRKRQDEKLKELKEYRIYSLIHTYPWELYTQYEPDPNRPGYERIKNTALHLNGDPSDKEIDEIFNTLVSIYGKDNVSLEETDFIIRYQRLNMLYKMDKFYHPYIPPDPSNLIP